jgi:hypothetical protein
MGVLRGTGGGLVGRSIGTGSSLAASGLLPLARTAVGVVARGGRGLRQVVVERGRVSVGVAQRSRAHPRRQRAERRRRLQSCRGTTSRHARSRYVVRRRFHSKRAAGTAATAMRDSRLFPPRTHKRPAILAPVRTRGHNSGPAAQKSMGARQGEGVRVGRLGAAERSLEETGLTGHNLGWNNHAQPAHDSSPETPHGIRRAW